MADSDSFLNIRALLTISCVSPIGSTEAERAASGIKTPYRSTTSDSREGGLNLIQLQKVTEIDKSKVAQIFFNLNHRRFFLSNSLFMIPITINQYVYYTKLILLY